MTTQIYGLKFGGNIHMLYQPGAEKDQLTDSLKYDRGVSSVSPNFLLHLYTADAPYSERERNLALFMAETYLFAISSVLSPIATTVREENSQENRVSDPFANRTEPNS